MEKLHYTHNHDNKNAVAKQTKLLRQWTRGVVRELRSKGFDQEANDMQGCGCSFLVRTCTKETSHPVRPIPVHCGLRICPEDEARESWRKLSRYLPALKKLVEPNPDYPDYQLKKLVLTTPYALTDLTSESFAIKQKLVNVFLSVYFYWYFYERGELSKAEKRSGRCNLAQHGIGGLISAEFGERGKKLHWHLLMYSPFMPHMDICAVWRDVTGDECKFGHVSGLYANKDGEIDDRVGVELAVKEVVKYATKFTELSPRYVPHLLKVLKGNRRFRTFGILYNAGVPDEEIGNICEECKSVMENVTVSEYIQRCEAKQIAPDDVITDAVDSGIEIYLTREDEISSGRPDRSCHKPRDSIDRS